MNGLTIETVTPLCLRDTTPLRSAASESAAPSRRAHDVESPGTLLEKSWSQGGERREPVVPVTPVIPYLLMMGSLLLLAAAAPAQLKPDEARSFGEPGDLVGLPCLVHETDVWLNVFWLESDQVSYRITLHTPDVPCNDAPLAAVAFGVQELDPPLPVFLPNVRHGSLYLLPLIFGPMPERERVSSAGGPWMLRWTLGVSIPVPVDHIVQGLVLTKGTAIPTQAIWLRGWR